MIRIRRRRLHRLTFAAAGIYNIAWGISTLIDPQWMYRLTGGVAPDRAEMASALGLVIGLYGLLYLDVAIEPERGWLIAAVGLIGKVAGPIGMVTLVIQGSWPPSALLICLTNDFIWWLPFALYLRDRWHGWRHHSLRQQEEDHRNGPVPGGVLQSVGQVAEPLLDGQHDAFTPRRRTS